MRRTAGLCSFRSIVFLLLGAAVVRPAQGQPIDRPISPEVRQAAAGFERAYASGEFAEALEHALRLVELHPGSGTPEYNVACLFARLEKKDEAVEWLERAIDAGYDNPAKIADDADLTSVRQHARFQELLGRAKEQFGQRSAIYLPEGFSPQTPAPLIVLLHNFGGNARSVMNQWREAADEAGAVLLAPKAPKNINPAQARWTTPDETEPIVLQQIDELRARHGNIAADRIVLAGMGQGGDMAYVLALKHPDSFCGLVSVAGHLVPASVGLAEAPGVEKLRAYLLVGDQDREADNCRAAAETLRAAGIAVELRMLPDMDRFFPTDRTAQQRRAIAFVLGESSGE
ncbi:MAG TPA: PHB depolymerase family esterase [Phycisphaerae bacterium]|nr:PHB depolymerase family esterase [Phycisphaerae bacterium]